jgi:hypothetical protein
MPRTKSGGYERETQNSAPAFASALSLNQTVCASSNSLIYGGSIVPARDFTIPMSDVVMLPFAFTSERKFAAVTGAPD